MNQLLSLEGRMNRARYLGSGLLIMTVVYALAFVAGMAIGLSGGDPDNAGLIGGLIGLAGGVAIALQAVKRLHDLGRPGTHYWLLFVPFYNFYLALLLLFKKGTEGANRYGADPLAHLS